MKLTRGKRIALELLGPAAIGATLLSLVMGGIALSEIGSNNKTVGKTLLEWAGGSLFVLVFAYIFVGAQSVVCTVILERRFKRGLDPASWKMVYISSALGFVSGGIAGLIGIRNNGQTAFFAGLIFGGIGLVVGFILGLLIKTGSARDNDDTRKSL